MVCVLVGYAPERTRDFERVLESVPTPALESTDLNVETGFLRMTLLPWWLCPGLTPTMDGYAVQG